MADQILRIKDQVGVIHDLAFAIQNGTYGLSTIPFSPDSNNSYGTVSNVTPGATVPLVSFTSTANYRVRGLVVTGDGDAYFQLLVAGVPVISGRLHILQKTLQLDLGHVNVTTGSTVVLNIRNDAGVGSSYEGFLLGE